MLFLVSRRKGCAFETSTLICSEGIFNEGVLALAAIQESEERVKAEMADVASKLLSASFWLSNRLIAYSG